MMRQWWTKRDEMARDESKFEEGIFHFSDKGGQL